jgi:ABC-type nickel/cobalt efflux system permease component RcnA
VETDAPASSLSNALVSYPDDLLNAPPQQTEARAVVALTAGARTAGTASTPPAAGPGEGAGSQPPAAVEGAAENRSASRLTELITAERLSGPILFVSLLIAFVLGAAHALEPGHGKTVVAAYLVGARGTPKHALLLGLIVTVAHTMGVFLLGIVTLFASAYVVPERLYPWLGVVSGLAITTVGLALLWRHARLWYLGSRWFNRMYRIGRMGASDGHSHAAHHHGHGHSHSHGHNHSHGDSYGHGHGHSHGHSHGGHEHGHSHPHGGHGHSHPHEHAHGGHRYDAHGHSHDAHVHEHPHEHVHAHHHDLPHDHGHAHGHSHGHAHVRAHGHSHGHGHHHHDYEGVLTEQGVRFGSLLALGISGGIVPCPGALVVLLSAVAMHRVGFGLALIVAFSMGLAAVLIGIGLLIVSTRGFLDRVPALGDGRWSERLAIASAAVVSVLGIGIALQALVAAGWLRLPV